MLKNLYAVFYEKNIKYKIKKAYPSSYYNINGYYRAFMFYYMNCSTYVLFNRSKDLSCFDIENDIYTERTTEITDEKPKKKMNNKLPQLNAREYDKVDYNDYLDHNNDYEDDSDEYDSNERDDSHYSESDEEESEE